jgi:SMC interacting uncharacterized protein involved in chromosome segregation
VSTVLPTLLGRMAIAGHRGLDNARPGIDPEGGGSAPTTREIIVAPNARLMLAGLSRRGGAPPATREG